MKGSELKPLARALRRNATETEKRLWRLLRSGQLQGYKFRRQQPIGQYIVDFICLEKRLIIELDGGQHAQQATYDSERSAWLESQGFWVLRFWNNQVLGEVEAVKTGILEALDRGANTPHPNLPPQGGKG